MSTISTHVLDTSRGTPAAGVRVALFVREGESWRRIGGGATDADGRLRDMIDGDAPAGDYRLGFDTGAYFEALGVEAFHPVIEITFRLRDAGQHHHVPLLLSPFGFTTYRGS